MKSYIQEFRGVFESEGLSLFSEKHTTKQFKDAKSQKNFDLYEEWALRGVFEGVRGLEVEDKEKFVAGMEEMSETEKKLFCLFGTATLNYSEFGDKFHVSSGSIRNMGIKMVGELEKGTIQVEDFVPAEQLQELKLKTVFEERKALRLLANHLLEKMYGMHRKMNESKKLMMMRNQIREPMKKIYVERKVEMKHQYS